MSFDSRHACATTSSVIRTGRDSARATNEPPRGFARLARKSGRKFCKSVRIRRETIRCVRSMNRGPMPIALGSASMRRRRISGKAPPCHVAILRITRPFSIDSTIGLLLRMIRPQQRIDVIAAKYIPLFKLTRRKKRVKPSHRSSSDARPMTAQSRKSNAC